jgi:hypothetical protein
MTSVRKNELLVILGSALRIVALLCATGPIMQAFLASLGFPSRFLYLHSTFTQGANILTIFLCSRWADRGSIIRRSALIQLPHAVLYLCFIPLCLWQSPSLESFLALTGICLLQSVFLALYTVCEYTLPYFIYPPEDTGPLTALCGILASLLSLGSGVIITWLANFLSYPLLMLYACCISSGLMLLNVLATLLMRPMEGITFAAKEQKRLPLKTVICHPIFYKLAGANLLRGFSFGVTTVMAAVALDLGFREGTLTALVSFQSAAGLIGCTAYGLLSRPVSSRKLIFWGSLGFLAVPFMLLPGEWLFFGAFTVMMIGRTIVDYAVPTAVRFAVPVELAGPYNALRMLLHNGGTLLATTLAAFLPVSILLILTTVLQLYSGLRYLTLREMRQVV